MVSANSSPYVHLLVGASFDQACLFTCCLINVESDTAIFFPSVVVRSSSRLLIESAESNATEGNERHQQGRKGRRDEEARRNDQELC